MHLPAGCFCFRAHWCRVTTATTPRLTTYNQCRARMHNSSVQEGSFTTLQIAVETVLSNQVTENFEASFPFKKLSQSTAREQTDLARFRQLLAAPAGRMELNKLSQYKRPKCPHRSDTLICKQTTYHFPMSAPLVGLSAPTVSLYPVFMIRGGLVNLLPTACNANFRASSASVCQPMLSASSNGQWMYCKNYAVSFMLLASDKSNHLLAYNQINCRTVTNFYSEKQRLLLLLPN